jgi:hypothetical protein
MLARMVCPWFVVVPLAITLSSTRIPRRHHPHRNLHISPKTQMGCNLIAIDVIVIVLPLK